MNRARTHKHRLTAGRLLLWASVVALAGLAVPPMARGAIEPGQAAPAPPGPTVVALKEIPVWELANEEVRESFLRGRYAPLSQGRQAGIQYPPLVSDAPWSGTVDFADGAGTADAPRVFYHFVLDCSQKGGDYDRLYFGDNGTTDLRDSKPRKPRTDVKGMAQRIASLKETYFEPVQVTLNFGSGGPQSWELLPCLRIYEGSVPQFHFIAARVHTGEFGIDGTTYEALVGHQYMIRGRFDQPYTTLLLAPKGGEPISWSGGNELCATHNLGGRYYRFACTPTGDKLTVQPYVGPLGVFEIGPGGRNVGVLTMVGSLRSATTAVAIGAGTSNRRVPEPVRSCQLPVGDYRIDDVFVQFGDLRALILNNYHADGKPMGKMESQNTYGMAVREDKPFVLEFSRQPQILFASPARDYRVKLGEELSVKAVLIDPALNVMFRILTHGERLDPKVVIKRANGEVVAEGTMPFG